MNVESFAASVDGGVPPADLGLALQSLWADASGDWKRAHELAQDDDSADGAWVHAFLHRKEGDLSNARYWYRRAGRPESTGTLEEEWREIARALLESR